MRDRWTSWILLVPRMQKPFCAMSKRCNLCLPLAHCIASSSMAKCPKRPKAPFCGERSSLIDLTSCLLIRWCQHSLCLQQRRSAWTDGARVSWLWQSFLKDLESVWHDSTKRSEVGFIFWKRFSRLDVFCFSADSCMVGTGRRQELLESWNIVKSKLWADYVDGFYLGVWFHQSKTKRGQQRLKGWHRLDLLEERPSRWYFFCADSQCTILIRASKMAGGFWGFNFKIERTRPSIACWIKLGIVDIINNLAGFTLQAWNFAIREKAFIFDLKNWTSPAKMYVRLICCKQILFDGTDWLTIYTRTSSCKWQKDHRITRRRKCVKAHSGGIELRILPRQRTLLESGFALHEKIFPFWAREKRACKGVRLLCCKRIWFKGIGWLTN